MNSSQRKLLFAAILLAMIVFLSYRSWSAYQFHARLREARTRLEQNEPELALFVVRPLLAAGQRHRELFYLAAWSYRLMGETARALEYLTLAEELGHNEFEIAQDRGLALFDLGRLQEAEPLLQASPSKTSMHALTLLHIERFEMDQALRDLDAWISLDPQNPIPFVLRGDVWVQAPDNEKAVEAYRRALELDPDDFEARVKLASALRELGRLDDAVALLRRCLEHEPTDFIATVLLARCEVESGEVASARLLLESVLKAQPNLSAALVELGKIELEEGNFDQAEHLLDRAVKLEPRNDSALYNLATALTRLDRGGEAAGPLARWNEVQESRKRLRAILDQIESDPTDIAAHVEASTLYMDLGETRQAARHITAALAAEPQHAGARKALNRWREQSSDNAAAPGLAPIQETRP
jgi:tetratricopeptide (TPR) repeat protein